MNNTKMSIVINTLGSKYLADIVGIYLLNLQNLELIIIFDDPMAVPQMYLLSSQIEDPRVIIEVNNQNQGIAKATNRGIYLSSGDIIVRNDDDDIPSSDRLPKIEEYFLSHQNVDILYSYARGFDEESGKQWVITGPTTNIRIQEKLLKRNFIVHSTVAFRKKSFERIGFYDETFWYSLDYDIYLRAMRSGLIFGCISEVLLTRVYHKGSITVSKRKKQILHSMAARILHAAQANRDTSVWIFFCRYIILLLIPNYLRNLRRKFGHGK